MDLKKKYEAEIKNKEMAWAQEAIDDARADGIFVVPENLTAEMVYIGANAGQWFDAANEFTECVKVLCAVMTMKGVDS